jgi:hypothetical protein
MRTVVVTGWNRGFQKVNFTKWLRSEFGYSLAEAKAATDAVLATQELVLQIPDPKANQLLERN